MDLYSALRVIASVAGWNEYPAKAGGVNRHRVIHQPVSVVSQCSLIAWLNELASGDTTTTITTK